KPFESQGGGYLSSQPIQSKNRKLSSESLNPKNNTNSAYFCRKKLDGVPGGKTTILNTENFSSTPAAKSLKILPSGPKCNAIHPSTKICVYFGLPPKRKEEKFLGESALKGINLNPVPSPNKKRSCDLEFDVKNLNESLSVGLSSERSQRQKKKRDLKSQIHCRKELKSKSSQNQFMVDCKGGTGKSQKKRHVHFYKKIPGTGFTVDAFQYGVVEGCTACFLTHFHSDHYAGLSKHFTFPVYCSEITGNLLKNELHVQEQYIHPLPLDTDCVVKVVLLDANHCPGAAMTLFCLPNGAVILHTGDFRADPRMERSLLVNRKVHVLYLDTTYCSPEYTFPSQQEVIQFAINTAFEAVTLNPRALVVCGTYSIADVLGSKKTPQCLNTPEINSFITTDMCSSLAHLLPMMQINFKGLQSHLNKNGGKYDQILAFRPTGWTHADKFTSIADVIPQTKGNISIYGIPYGAAVWGRLPYSEHSSYLEIKHFVQWLKPQKIIPTVNAGTWKSRSTMEKYFRVWKLEAGY
uniref:DNA repair metallo-beta-lactamase domain-containing protein n=1 Tax=Saimiri boliviensis boliviensis TaxID=39432 RepID=A0A2K6SZ02_SAIBB